MCGADEELVVYVVTVARSVLSRISRFMLFYDNSVHLLASPHDSDKVAEFGSKCVL